MTNIAEQIIQWHGDKPQPFRPHLGASIIGKACEREIWYSLHWADKKKFDGRMIRLFQTGHLAESRFVAELKGIGATVWQQTEDGKQFGFKAMAGHFSGSVDAVADNLPGIEGPALVEMKTHGDKSFQWLKQNTVGVAKPDHLAQMQIYMGYLGLENALYLATNKNTDELYSEIVPFDKALFDELFARAHRILSSSNPPGRMADPKCFDCTYCSFASICRGTEIPLDNCRTCASSTVDLDDGGWICERKQAKPETELQEIGCGDHLFIPSLLENFATPIGGNENEVQYKHAQGFEFWNSPVKYHNGDKTKYASSELRLLGGEHLDEKNVIEFKTALPGSKVIEIMDIESDDLTKAKIKKEKPKK
jgi:hypothetical protein